jgi:hypothetical protein
MDKWTYVLVFDDAVGTRREVLDFLDKLPEILNWYACMSNAVFVVSNKTANELADLFRKFTKDKGRFVILDTETDRNGWLPKPAWEFIRNPRPAETEQRSNK